jgi:hypothetical protein
MRSGLVLLLVLVISMAVCAQQSASFDSRMSAALSGMKSANLATKEKTFDDVMTLISEEQHQAPMTGQADAFATFFAHHPDQAEPVKLGLIELLDSANNLFVSGKNATPGTYTEDDTEHYARIIDAVSSLDDERAIPALVGAMTTGGMAQRGLLKYGDKALGPVLEQLRNPDNLVRASALGLSVALLERSNDLKSRKRAVEIVRLALADPSSVVRGHAVREIDCLGQRQEFVPILERIASTDPEKLLGKASDGGDGDEFYPVRYDARQVLRDIQTNSTCKPQ